MECIKTMKAIDHKEIVVFQPTYCFIYSYSCVIIHTVLYFIVWIYRSIEFLGWLLKINWKPNCTVLYWHLRSIPQWSWFVVDSPQPHLLLLIISNNLCTSIHKIYQTVPIWWKFHSGVIGVIQKFSHESLKLISFFYCGSCRPLLALGWVSGIGWMPRRENISECDWRRNPAA